MGPAPTHENDPLAEANRKDFAAAGVRAVNVMSSPGAGKTTLLRETLLRIGARRRVGIVEGDLETRLDAAFVRSALLRLPLAELDLLLIEQTGNLLCPTEFSVGEGARAMVYAVTDGEEQPLKYPAMFRSADVVLVNKTDLLPYLDFDLELFYHNLAKVNPKTEVIEISARSGLGVDAWCDWLLALRDRSSGRQPAW